MKLFTGKTGIKRLVVVSVESLILFKGNINSELCQTKTCLAVKTNYLLNPSQQLYNKSFNLVVATLFQLFLLKFIKQWLI